MDFLKPVHDKVKINYVIGITKIHFTFHHPSACFFTSYGSAFKLPYFVCKCTPIPAAWKLVCWSLSDLHRVHIWKSWHGLLYRISSQFSGGNGTFSLKRKNGVSKKLCYICHPQTRWAPHFAHCLLFVAQVWRLSGRDFLLPFFILPDELKREANNSHCFLKPNCGESDS